MIALMDDPALSNLVDLARRALGVQAAGLATFGGGPADLRVAALIRRGAEPEPGSVERSALRAGTRAGPVWEPCCAAQPIVRGGRVSGALAAVCSSPRAWTDDDRRTLGACVQAVEEHLARLDIATEHTALHRVATVVATTSRAEDVYEAVCDELVALIGVPMSTVKRFRGPRVEALAARGIPLATAAKICEAIWAGGTSAAADRYREGRTYHISDTAACDSADAHRFRAHDVGSVAGAPVFVEGELWGSIFVGAHAPEAVGDESAGRLTRFAELVSLAVSNAEARTRLAEEATSDSLTRLANHRRFHEALRAEAKRAERLGVPLAVALVDVDQFKQVNDTLGHHEGDEVLRHVAQAFLHTVRDGELVARLGGDEFAAILPGSDDVGAEAFGERLRERIRASTLLRTHGITISVGVTDTAHARDPDTLIRLADGALYWAKEHGRDTVCRYAPGVVVTLSERDRAEKLARGQALTAMRALVRALDLSDPSTQRHAQRVAQLAQQMAATLHWNGDDRERLADAALLHDIGKIAIPDEILHKPGRLDRHEYAVIKTHAALGGEIVSEALDPEQVAWVQHHHERPDGRGYPAGLRDEEIPSGAAIIGVADAFDVMTTARHYREPVTAEAALAECERQACVQFSPSAVAALRAVLGCRNGPEQAASRRRARHNGGHASPAQCQDR